LRDSVGSIERPDPGRLTSGRRAAVNYSAASQPASPPARCLGRRRSTLSYKPTTTAAAATPAGRTQFAPVTTRCEPRQRWTPDTGRSNGSAHGQVAGITDRSAAAAAAAAAATVDIARDRISGWSRAEGLALLMTVTRAPRPAGDVN